MKRILFIPSDHGGGKGHASRALYLAKTAQAQGYETGIVLERNISRMPGMPVFRGFSWIREWSGFKNISLKNHLNRICS